MLPSFSSRVKKWYQLSTEGFKLIFAGIFFLVLFFSIFSVCFGLVFFLSFPFYSAGKEVKKMRDTSLEVKAKKPKLNIFEDSFQ